MEKYYRRSGKFSPRALLMLPVGIVMAIVFGVIYAYLNWYNPFIYITVVATLFGAWFFGIFASKVVVKVGKIRSLAVAVIIGLLLAIIIDYTQWVIWIDLAFNATDNVGNDQIGFLVSNVKSEELLYLAFNPDLVWQHIDTIRSVGGVWTIKGSKMHPLFLAVIWGIETLIFLIVTTIGFTSQTDEPFCETTGTWHEQQAYPLVYIGEPQETVDFLKSGNRKWLDNVYVGKDFDAIAASEEDEEDDTGHFPGRLQLYTSGDRNNSFVKLERIITKVNKKGESETTPVEILPPLNIDQKMYLALKDQIENGRPKVEKPISDGEHHDDLPDEGWLDDEGDEA